MTAPSTGEVYAGFFPKAILGATVMQDDIFGAVRTDVLSLAANVVGECVFDPDLDGLGITTSEGVDALNERKLTVTGDLPVAIGNGSVVNHAGSTAALSQLVEGSRTITLNDPAWYTSLPYANANGITYRVYIASTEVPIDVGISSKGTTRGYSRYVGVPGIQINPDVVVDAGAYLNLFVDTGLTGLGIQHWLTANSLSDSWSYDVVVWLDTDQDGVAIASDDPDVAIVTGKLHKRAGDARWVVSLNGLGDGKLGQGVASTTVAHYKIAVLGPIITTTDFDSNDDYFFVGTTTSSVPSEAESTAGQRIVKNLSDALIALVSVPQQILYKGWITGPSTVVAGPQLQITSIGSAYVHADIAATPTQNLTNMGISSTVYVYYDANVAVRAWASSTDWDTANGTNCIPMWRLETDGAQDITLLTPIGRYMKVFNQELVLTVSNATGINAQFESISQALAFCAALKASGGIARRGIVIEIIGDTTETVTVSDGDLLAVENVTFRGRSGGGIRAGLSVPASIAGSRIIWAFDGSLFTINTAILMRNWRFEDLTFRFATDATAATAAVISNTAGTISGLSFYNCTVDGSNALLTVGGANGYLPHVLYHAGVGCRGVSFEACQLHSAEAAIYAAAGATAGFIDMTVAKCEATNDSGAMTFSQGGMLVDRCTTVGQTAWTIVDCKTSFAFPLQGPGIEAYVVKGCRIRGNDVLVSGNFSCVLLGNATTDDDVERVFMSANQLSQAGGTNAPVVKIITQDQGVTVRCGIFISDNIISGSGGTAAGSVGIQFNGGAAGADGASTSGVMIHDNLVYNVETAVSLRVVDRSVVHSNSLPRAKVGLISASCAGLVVAHNTIGTTFAGGAGKGIESDARVISGNTVFIDSSTAATGIKATHTDGNIVMGNLIDMDADAGSGIGVYMDESGVCAANWVNDNNSAAYGIKADDNFTIIGLNYVLGASIQATACLNSLVVANGTDLNIETAQGGGTFGGVIGLNYSGSGAFKCVFSALGSFIGNVAAGGVGVGDMEVGGTCTVVGNYGAQFDIDTPATEGNTMSVTGNVFIDWDDTVTSHDMAWTGNVFTTASALSFVGDDGALVANVFNGDVTLAVGADGWSFSANRGTAFTNSGAGNTVSGANNT